MACVICLMSCVTCEKVVEIIRGGSVINKAYYTIGSSVTTDKCTGHWCIKLIYHGFAIAKEYTLKFVPFGFCSAQVMLFSESPFGYLGEVTKVCLAVVCGFFGFRHI